MRLNDGHGIMFGTDLGWLACSCAVLLVVLLTRLLIHVRDEDVTEKMSANHSFTMFVKVVGSCFLNHSRFSTQDACQYRQQAPKMHWLLSGHKSTVNNMC